MAVVGLSATVYLDHNVDPQLATDLRVEDYDVVFADEIGMATATDEEHLRYAASTGRILVTHDFRDFQELAEAWFARGESHAGIILAHQPPRLPYHELRRRLLALLDRMTAEELQNQVIWLTAEPQP